MVAIATANKNLHYSTQADMVAARRYYEENGTLEGFQSPSGNYDWMDWSNVPAAAAYAGSDGIWQPDEMDNLLSASERVWGGKPKEKSDLTKAGQGVVRVAKIIPGPHQAALNVLDQMSGNKLSGHEISKNPFINAAAGAAGGAAGYALGTSESTSLTNAMKSGARMQLQDQMGMQPYARQGLRQLQSGWNPYKGDEQLDPNQVYGQSTGEYQGPQVDPITGERTKPGSMEDYWQGIGQAGESLNQGGVPITESNQADWMKQNYPGAYDGTGNSTPSKTTTGGGMPAGGGTGAAQTVPGAGGNNMFGMAALALLADSMKKDDKANVAPPASTPYGAGGTGLPTYKDLGLITNQQVREDQMRRLRKAV